MKECEGCGHRTATQSRQLGTTTKNVCSYCIQVLKNLGLVPTDEEGEQQQ